jgi:tape measure domain-containing protein
MIGIAAAGIGVVGVGVKLAAEYQQAQITFEQFLGSAEKGNAFLDELQQFAAKTPFEFPELRTAASSLLSVGIEADKVIPIMTSLGNATSGMGTGAEGVRRATVALQQMSASGRITAEDLNQLRDAGIPVFDLLTAATGKTQEQVAELARTGGLGRTEMEQLFKALETGKGLERFNGLMEKQSQTLIGLFATLKDTIGQQLVTIADPLVRGLTSAMPKLSKQLGATMGAIGPIFADVLGSIVTVIGELLPVITPVIVVLGKLFGEVLKALVPLIQALVPVITDLIQEFSPLLPIIVGIVKVLVAGLIPALQVMAPILPEIVAGFAAFKVIRGVQSMFTGLLGTIPKLIAGLLGTATAEGAVGTAATTMLGPWALIAAAVVFLAILIFKNWDHIKKVLVAIWNFIKKTAIVIWNAIKSYFVGLWNSLRASAIQVWNAIKGAVIAVWNALKSAARTIWNALKAAVMAPINALRTGLKTAWNLIKGAAQTSWNAIKGVILGVWDAVVGGIKTAINGLIGILNTAIGGINTLIRGYNKIPFAPNIGEIPPIPTLARGIRDFLGGLAIVGEAGPELVQLPKGSNVFSNRETRGLVKSRGGRSSNPTLSLAGLRIAGRLDTPWGPSEMEGFVVDEIDDQDRHRRTMDRMRRSA